MMGLLHVHMFFMSQERMKPGRGAGRVFNLDNGGRCVALVGESWPHLALAGQW